MEGEGERMVVGWIEGGWDAERNGGSTYFLMTMG